MRVLRNSIPAKYVFNTLFEIKDSLIQMNEDKNFTFLIDTKNIEKLKIKIIHETKELPEYILALIPNDELEVSDQIILTPPSKIEDWLQAIGKTIIYFRLQAIIDSIRHDKESISKIPTVLVFDIIEGNFSSMSISKFNRLLSPVRYQKMTQWSRHNPINKNAVNLWKNIPKEVRKVIQATVMMDIALDDNED